MEKKGQYVRLSAIHQVRRTCSAPRLVTRGWRECQGPVWSPGGQLPYEYIKKRKRVPVGGLATRRCGGHAQVSRQAKHYAHKGIITLVSCDGLQTTTTPRLREN